MNYLKPCPKCRMPAARVVTEPSIAELARVTVACSSCNHESKPPAYTTFDKQAEAEKFAATRWNNERRMDD